MTTVPTLPATEKSYRRILGVRFFVGDTPEAVEIGARGGLVVVPAAPAMLELGRNRDYRQALLEADLAITDSGFMVILWNVMMWDRIQRVSGLEYLKLLLKRPEFYEPGAALWIMPSETSLERNLVWLQSQGCSIRREDCHVAPKYAREVADDSLVALVNQRKPRHIIIGLGGGVQEKLGLYLKHHCAARPAIHCIGAAIGFLSGDQVGFRTGPTNGCWAGSFAARPIPDVLCPVTSKPCNCCWFSGNITAGCRIYGLKPEPQYSTRLLSCLPIPNALCLRPLHCRRMRPAVPPGFPGPGWATGKPSCYSRSAPAGFYFSTNCGMNGR